MLNLALLYRDLIEGYLRLEDHYRRLKYLKKELRICEKIAGLVRPAVVKKREALAEPSAVALLVSIDSERD